MKFTRLKFNNLIKRYNHNYTGSHIIYNKLLSHNVKDVFIYSGGAIMPLVDRFYENNIKYYIPTNELSLGLSAVGYAKSTGKPGVCIVTSGPGLTNMVTSITDAQHDSTPLIVLSGQVPLNAMGKLSFQECPATEITKKVTKWSYCVKEVSELPSVMDKAFRISQEGKPGCVHIDLPKCILSSKINNLLFTEETYYPSTLDKLHQIKRSNNYPQTLEKIETKENDTSFNSKVDHASRIINSSQKPILYLGKGCLEYSEQITELANYCNIPVTTTLHAMGVYDENQFLSLKMVGMHGSMAANLSIQNSDLVIALGSRFDDRTTGLASKYAPDSKIIHVNIDNKEENKVINSDIFFNNDVGIVLEHLQPRLNKNISDNNWIQSIQKLKEKYPFDYSITENMKTQDVLKSLNDYLMYRKDYFITTGVGNHQMMTCQYINWSRPRSIISSGSLGVMGAGLPYAIGCQIANPDCLVIDIDGDGSFNMTGMELSTIKRYNLPVKIFIMNNKKQDMVRVWEDLFFEKRFTATDLPSNPDYVSLSKSFGIKSLNCDSKKDIDTTIEYALNYKGPILVNFNTDIDYCLPLVAPGKSLNETYNYQEKEKIFSEEVFKNSLPPS